MQVHVSTVQDTAVLRCEGRLTMANVPTLTSAIDEVVDGGQSHVVVDLSETMFVDSSGLGGLVAGLKRARAAGGGLRIAEAPEQVRMVLGLTNLDRILPPYDRLEDAVRGW